MFPLIQCKASKEFDQPIILQMVNDARKDSKTISMDSAGWIGATLVLDKTNILD